MTCKDTGVYIELNSLSSFAKNAASETITHGTVRASNIAEEIGDDLKKIKSAVLRLNSRYSGSTVMPKTAEWILDNWYIADREGQNTVGDFRNIKRLPKDKKTGMAVVVSAACALVESGRGEISEERIAVFLDSFQNERILNEAELCAFIPSVKAALVSLLKYTCENIEESEISVERVFVSLRFLEGFDFTELMESVNRIETILRTDPAGVYSRMDETTRQGYRRRVSILARRSGLTEYDTAKMAVRFSEENNTHVGFYLFKKPLNKDRIEKTGAGYIVPILFISLFITILLGIVMDNIFVTVLLLLPIWEIVKNIFDFGAAKLVPPDWIHRMALENGIPSDSKTVCVISILLTSKDSAKKAVRLLEEFSITNSDAGRNLNFGLLADLKESDVAENDADREIISVVKHEIDVLNEKYGNKFYLFTRKRVWCESSKRYMGWERKRGAILELVQLLLGKPTGMTVQAGNTENLHGTAYIITLDSDTRLTAGSAIQLVGAMMHPLNRPVICENGVVTDGYGIIQPRISVELKSANRSDFTRIFAGQGGIDPYGGRVSDLYQDMFSCGSFTGKGIIDVNAYYHCLNDKLPTDTILSHDLLEGAFLGCGYMGDTEFVDSCPQKVTSYYERMHRWVRGDWQNCGFLCKKSQLSPLNKWKIFDNLRRSLTPIFTMAAILSGMLSKWSVFGWVSAIAILSAMTNLFITSAEIVFRRNGVLRIKYLSGIISGFGGLLMQTIIRLMLLPYEAWICLSAIATALYRLCISKRNLLQWTTAADSDKGAGVTVMSFYRKMLACPIVGIAILLATPYAAAGAVGIVWILTPFYAWALSKCIDRERSIAEPDKRFLLSCAGDIWKYFEDFVAPIDNFLPPDNWQEQPANGIAHRTSPTNIGLALLSAVAAIDLKLTTKHKALGIIENILTTVERLPKWNGHLYNWYDTRTLKVLEPAYVSTVDSGNFAGDLIALREALLELGENDLADKADELYQIMSFTHLYDNKRKLFYIGWDAVKNQPTRSYYDLLASEARQTSYIGVAKGDVPKKHWRQLSRALVSQDGYLGVVSWTGTMFEYLMPHLLLPCYRDSLLYESTKFCVYVQKNDKSAPVWGKSESAYYSFDPALNYQYKAHGAQKLALKRGLGMDNVISPYSSFLALTLDFKSAVHNLRVLRDMGTEGRYGFYEAVDFTPIRVGADEFKIVRNYMVHHLGMSLLSIDNALMGGIMQKRFMRDINMASYSELLQEKIPQGAVVLKKRPREIPEKPKRSSNNSWTQTPDNANMRDPSCCLLSNGAYSVLVSNFGQTRSQWGDIQITRFIPEQDSRWQGVEIFINTDDESFSINQSIDSPTDVDYGAEFSGTKASLTARTSRLAASMTVRVPENEYGELREINLTRIERTPVSGELVIKLSPVLARGADFASHPSFSKLSLEAWKQDEALIIRRRSRGDKGEAFMCLVCDKPVVFETEGNSPRNSSGVVKKYSTEMNVTAKIGFNIDANSSETIKFAIGAADSAQGAIEAAERVLLSKENNFSRLDRIANELELTPKDVEQAMSYVSGIVYVTSDRQHMASAIVSNQNGKEGLWRFGISGDIPISLAEINSETKLESALKLVRQHSLLIENGLLFDLILLITEVGDYRNPIKQAITDELHRLGREFRIGAFGGVHLIDASSEGVDAIEAWVCKEVEI